MQYLNIIAGNKPNFYTLYNHQFQFDLNAVMKWPFFIQISSIVNQATVVMAKKACSQVVHMLWFILSS